jgi:hypothetical protein
MAPPVTDLMADYVFGGGGSGGSGSGDFPW